MDNPKYLWIQTRDGSPTLWSNELSESFRSIKGAFIESWSAFVAPALAFATQHLPQQPIIIGEFGLGPGTNWVLSATAAAKLGIAFEYHVIEKDSESFNLGCTRWALEFDRINEFVNRHLEQLGLLPAGTPDPILFESLKLPNIYPSLAAAVDTASNPPFAANIWFHDPFGYEVNPEGYAPATLVDCAKLWQTRLWGGSYACNRHFKAALENLPGVSTQIVGMNSAQLKRQRLEFFRY